jgi:uncharacterized protein
MYERFGLVLMVTHACNLRCSYCYTGTKTGRPMSPTVGRAAIERAAASIHPGGTLELGFFGGEPLLCSAFVAAMIDLAAQRTARAHVALEVSLTTNGTRTDGEAWAVMTRPGVQITVSHDGLPAAHDRHRRLPDGRGTSQLVQATIRRLLDAGVAVRVMTIVRPDTAESLPEGIAWLFDQGVCHVDLVLDLWTHWSRRGAGRLQRALGRAADVWRAGLPDCSVGWFDEKAARLAGISESPTARCGFGDGEVAVAPSGNLYPCERLIGEDAPGNPMRLPGHALDRGPFHRMAAPSRAAEGCSACAIQGQCQTTCRCSNYVRTGDVRRPDGLLCMLDQVLYRETARALGRPREESFLPVSSLSS